MTRREDDTTVTASSGNVFADLGFASAELELAKARMVQTIADEIERRGLSQRDAGAIIGLPQPKLSTLLRGQWSSYSLDRLVRFTTLLGLDVTVRIERPGDAADDDRPGHLTVAA